MILLTVLLTVQGAALLLLALRLGSAAVRIEAGMRRLELAEEIPAVLVRLGTVEGVAARNTSDIRELAERQSSRITLPGFGGTT